MRYGFFRQPGGAGHDGPNGERECWLSSHATIMAPGLVRSAENADPADTSGFDRFAAQGTALSALIAFAG
jgi:hypothetical protein